MRSKPARLEQSGRVFLFHSQIARVLNFIYVTWQLCSPSAISLTKGILMQRKTIVVLVVVGIIIFIALSIFGWATGVYNSLVKLDESVNQSWAQVQNQYQRRADLIPNLVETVRGYAAHESQVFTDVAEARASVGKIQLTPEMLNDPQTFQKFEQA